MLLPVFALLCVSGVLVWQILGAEGTVARMEIADQNIATADLIAALITDEETGVRGYQNTSNPIFLQPYQYAADPLRMNFHNLRAGIASQHGDLRPVDALERAHRRWLYEIAIPMVATVDASGDTKDASINLRGKAYMDHIRKLEHGIVKTEETERTYLVQHWHTEVLDTLEAIVGLALIIGLMIGAFARSRLQRVSDAYRITIEEQRRTQEALLATEKLAVSGRLAAEIAHEIHNPLDSVVNLLYLMKQGTTEEERKEFVDMAQAELRRVTHISRTMLGMYRESRVPVDLDISELMKDLLEVLASRVRKAGLTVEAQLASDAIAVGFSAELRDVFVHLLTNAVEASSPGGRIEVRVWRGEPSHANASPSVGVVPLSSSVSASVCDVFVSIADHGRGIPAGDRERLFRPFFTTKMDPGTGLGLWTSQTIVRKHGGAITVDTSTDPVAHGTTVTVSLPCGDNQAVARRAAAASQMDSQLSSHFDSQLSSS